MAPFDHARALAAVDGDTALLKELLVLFRQEVPDVLKQINSAIQAQAPDDLRLHAHKLKGTLSILGANEAARTAAALETLARHNTLGDADVFYEQLVAQVHQFDRAAAEYERTLA
ncbi:MAG: Hpt domain-containing protein [Candidatus Zixiibacteriota bacterium]